MAEWMTLHHDRKYDLLALQMAGSVTQSNGTVRTFRNDFFYARTDTVSTPPTSAVKTSLVTAAGGFYTNASGPYKLLLAALNERYVSQGVFARFPLDVLDPWSLVQADTTAGTIATASAPDQLCVTIRKKSALRGRSGIGSWHFGPISAADITNDEISTAGIANWKTALIASLTATITDGTDTYSPVLVSASLSNVKERPTVAVFTPITSVAVDKAIGSIKKRREKSNKTA